MTSTFLCLPPSYIHSRYYPAINWKHQHSSNKPKADWGPCHRRNKWGKSLSLPMFLSPLTLLHVCAGTFMDCLIQCCRIKTKSWQTGLNPLCDESPSILYTQKNKHFINNKTLLYFIFSLWSNLFSSTFFSRSAFFLLVKMGFVLMSWA